jgi:hypothetical protein
VGATDLNEKQLEAPLRVYVQTDPVTWELRLANGDKHAKEAFDNHHYLFTYGENYGAKDCAVPLNGLTYYKTRQPIDLDLWPMAFDANAQYFTTIGNYRQNGADVEYQGKTYHWSKHHEWQKFIDLPSRTSQRFELAIMAEMRTTRVSRSTVGNYFVLSKCLSISLAHILNISDVRGENLPSPKTKIFECAAAGSVNAMYVISRRATRDCPRDSFSNILPTGEGLFAFRKMEDVLEALEKINSDYEGQCRAARKLAEDYFDGKKS